MEEKVKDVDEVVEQDKEEKEKVLDMELLSVPKFGGEGHFWKVE